MLVLRIFFLFILIFALKAAGISQAELQIVRLHCGLLDRCPDPNGLHLWLNAYNEVNGQMNILVGNMAQTDEFRLKHSGNGMDPMQAIYNRLLMRTISPGSERFWRRKLHSQGWPSIARQLVNSPAYKSQFGTALVPNGNKDCGC